MHYVAHKRIKNPVFGMAFHSSDGTWVNGSNTRSSGCDIDWVEGKGKVTYCVDDLPLLEGNYLFTATAYDYGGYVHLAHDHLDKAFLVQVQCSREISEPLGIVHIPYHWEHEKL
jgi:lipopolysaccharide transport system ATP-binding protein